MFVNSLNEATQQQEAQTLVAPWWGRSFLVLGDPAARETALPEANFLLGEEPASVLRSPVMWEAPGSSQGALKFQVGNGRTGGRAGG